MDCFRSKSKDDGAITLSSRSHHCTSYRPERCGRGLAAPAFLTPPPPRRFTSIQIGAESGAVITDNRSKTNKHVVSAPPSPGRPSSPPLEIAFYGHQGPQYAYVLSRCSRPERGCWATACYWTTGATTCSRTISEWNRATPEPVLIRLEQQPQEQLILNQMRRLTVRLLVGVLTSGLMRYSQ